MARLNPEDIQPWAILDGFGWEQCYAMEQSIRIDGPLPQDS